MSSVTQKYSLPERINHISMSDMLFENLIGFIFVCHAHAMHAGATDAYWSTQSSLAFSVYIMS